MRLFDMFLPFCDITAHSDTDMSLLQTASTYNHRTNEEFTLVVQKLINLGVDIDENQGLDRCTALSKAFMERQFNTALVLMENGANINIKDEISGNSLLHQACHLSSKFFWIIFYVKEEHPNGSSFKGFNAFLFEM